MSRIPFQSTALLIAATAILFGFEQTDPFQPKDILDPAAAAAKLKGDKSAQPLMLQVGFESIYKGAHVPGSPYAGPGSTPAGLANLEMAVKGVAHDREIVLYCGCCPWEKCPNIRPAFRKLKELGYTNVKVVKIPTNLHTDWVEPGYPIEKGS